MVIDYEQNKDSVAISYVNEQNQIDIINAPLKFGYYKYVRADLFDTNKLETIKSFKNDDFIKRESAKYFDKHNINEFLNQELKVHQPEIHKKISQLKIPNPFSVDIETEITDETGYSSAELAENKILSISVTDINLGTFVFLLENPDYPEFNEIDELYIDSCLQASLGEYHQQINGFKIRIFKNEAEMLNLFLEFVNKYFHSMFGWYFPTYDWQYIYNRCVRLGIDIRKASPTNKATVKSYRVKKSKAGDITVDVKIPNHRLINDYMGFFKSSLIYNNLGNYSLDSIASMVLGTKKVTYSGNLRTLYNTDFRKFVAYAIVDTILVMLLHRKTNLYNVDFFEAYFNGIAYNKISQNAISEALVYNELRNDNLFLLESEFNHALKEEYEGGFVKLPLRKIMRAGMGFDFSGLYPNSIITIGISPERLVDKIEVNADGIPINESEMKKWLEYKEQNCCLSPLGNVYSLAGGDGLFVRIEKKLIAQRKIFKGHAEDIYLEVITKIENRIAELQQAA